MTKRKTTTRISARVPANACRAVSNEQPRFIIASQFSEDVDTGLVRPTDKCLIAIVYARTAQHAIGRYRKQFNDPYLDIEAIEINQKEAQKIIKMCIYVFNKGLLEKNEEPMTQTELEMNYSKMNMQYNIKLSHARAKMKKVVAAKNNPVPQAKTSGISLAEEFEREVDQAIAKEKVVTKKKVVKKKAVKKVAKKAAKKTKKSTRVKASKK